MARECIGSPSSSPSLSSNGRRSRSRSPVPWPLVSPARDGEESQDQLLGSGSSAPEVEESADTPEVLIAVCGPSSGTFDQEAPLSEIGICGEFDLVLYPPSLSLSESQFELLAVKGAMDTFGTVEAAQDTRLAVVAHQREACAEPANAGSADVVSTDADVEKFYPVLQEVYSRRCCIREDSCLLLLHDAHNTWLALQALSRWFLGREPCCAQMEKKDKFLWATVDVSAFRLAGASPSLHFERNNKQKASPEA